LGKLPHLVRSGTPNRETSPSSAESTEASLGRQLSFRCDEVASQLRRVGIEARRLDDTGLAELYMACWAPERARTQRLRQQLHEYTALVVRGAAASGR
jgi:adenylylsulfate kinase-like enzyme